MIDLEDGVMEGLSLEGSRPASGLLETPQREPTINPALAQLLEEDREKFDLGPEEV